MPYNNTPIAPPKDISGSVSLPLARVQKIINADPERLHTSKNGAFAIALATEMFIQHLATSTHNVVKAERKPRRNIQYRDVASAIAKTDNLEFLVDVVPKTVLYKEYKKRLENEKKAKGLEAEGKEKEAQPKNGTEMTAAATDDEDENVDGRIGEQTASSQDLPLLASSVGPLARSETVVEAMEIDEPPSQEVQRTEDSEPGDDGAAMQLEMEMRGPRTNGSPTMPRAEHPPPVTHLRHSSGFTPINGTN